MYLLFIIPLSHQGWIQLKPNEKTNLASGDAASRSEEEAATTADGNRDSAEKRFEFLNDEGGLKSDPPILSKRTSSRLRTELLAEVFRARLDVASGCWKTGSKKRPFRPASFVDEAEDEVGVTSRGLANDNP